MKRLAVAITCLALVACETPDPKAELEATDFEAYWIVESSRGSTHYIAPAVRFQLHHKGSKPRGAVQATATFHRVGAESESWGSDWQQVAGVKDPLQPGETRRVLMKSDAHYYSDGPIEGMFAHEKFEDTTVEVFLRVGSSGWVKFGGVPVERAIGAPEVRNLPPPGIALPQPPYATSPSPITASPTP